VTQTEAQLNRNDTGPGQHPVLTDPDILRIPPAIAGCRSKIHHL